MNFSPRYPRVIVEESVHDAFVDGLAQRAARIRVENPVEDGTTMGPLISQKQMERVLGNIKSGRREGAQTICGVERAGNASYFCPTDRFCRCRCDDDHCSRRDFRTRRFGLAILR